MFKLSYLLCFSLIFNVVCFAQDSITTPKTEGIDAIIQIKQASPYGGTVTGRPIMKLYSKNYYRKGIIILNDGKILEPFIDKHFMIEQGIDYFLDTIQEKPTYIAAKNIKEVVFNNEHYHRISGFKGGLEERFSVNDKTEFVLVPVKGDWFVTFLVEGKLSLAISRTAPVSKNMQIRLKDKYVHKVIVHLVSGDKSDGENYNEILGSYKKRIELLKSFFGEYPDLMTIVNEIDFSKEGYTQKTLDQFIYLVTQYNERNR